MSDKEINDSAMDDLLDIDALHDEEMKYDDKNDESLLEDNSEDKVLDAEVVFWQPEDENKADDGIDESKEEEDKSHVENKEDEKENEDDKNETNLDIDEKVTSTPSTNFESTIIITNNDTHNNIEIHSDSHLEIDIQVGKDHELLPEDEIDHHHHEPNTDDADNDEADEHHHITTDKTDEVTNPTENESKSDFRDTEESNLEPNAITTVISTNNNDNNKRKHSISPILWDALNGGAVAAKKVKTGPTKDRESRLKYIFRSARFFLIKSNNHENVVLAKTKGVWSTPSQNEARLNQAFKLCANVILIFSVTESGKFQGFARLASESDKNHPPVKWILPPGLEHKAFTSVFKIDWISRNDLDFHGTMHLKNPWNSNRPVKIGRDGQEIEPTVGEIVCRMFSEDAGVDLHRIASLAKHSLRRAHTQATLPATAAPDALAVGGGGVGGDSSGGGGGYMLPSVVSGAPGNSAVGGGYHHHHQGGVLTSSLPPPPSSSLSSTSHMNNVDREPRYDDLNRRRPADRRFDGYHMGRTETEGDGIPVRYGVRREVLLNGSYSDYVREFTNAPGPSSYAPLPLPSNSSYLYLQSPPPVYPVYNRSSVYPNQPPSAPNPIDYANQHALNPYSQYPSNAYLSNQAPNSVPSNPAGYPDQRIVHYQESSSASFRDNYDYKHSRSHHR